VLARLNHVASVIVKANHSIMRAAVKFRETDCVADCVWLAVPEATERERTNSAGKPQFVMPNQECICKPTGPARGERPIVSYNDPNQQGFQSAPARGERLRASAKVSWCQGFNPRLHAAASAGGVDGSFFTAKRACRERNEVRRVIQTSQAALLLLSRCKAMPPQQS
jgi:hypothetical protein